MSDCQKKRNRCFLINEVGKIVRFHLVLQATNLKKRGYLFCYEVRENMPTAHTNADACSQESSGLH